MPKGAPPAAKRSGKVSSLPKTGRKVGRPKGKVLKGMCISLSCAFVSRALVPWCLLCSTDVPRPERKKRGSKERQYSLENVLAACKEYCTLLRLRGRGDRGRTQIQHLKRKSARSIYGHYGITKKVFITSLYPRWQESRRSGQKFTLPPRGKPKTFDKQEREDILLALDAATLLNQKRLPEGRACSVAQKVVYSDKTVTVKQLRAIVKDSKQHNSSKPKKMDPAKLAAATEPKMRSFFAVRNSVIYDLSNEQRQLLYDNTPWVPLPSEFASIANKVPVFRTLSNLDETGSKSEGTTLRQRFGNTALSNYGSSSLGNGAHATLVSGAFLAPCVCLFLTNAFFLVLCRSLFPRSTCKRGRRGSYLLLWLSRM